MTFTQWLYSQTFSFKLIFGLAVSLIVYGGLRYLIYLANRDAKVIAKTAPKLNEEQRIKLQTE